MAKPPLIEKAYAIVSWSSCSPYLGRRGYKIKTQVKVWIKSRLTKAVRNVAVIPSSVVRREAPRPIGSVIRISDVEKGNDSMVLSLGSWFELRSTLSLNYTPGQGDPLLKVKRKTFGIPWPDSLQYWGERSVRELKCQVCAILHFNLPGFGSWQPTLLSTRGQNSGLPNPWWLNWRIARTWYFSSHFFVLLFLFLYYVSVIRSCFCVLFFGFSFI